MSASRWSASTSLRRRLSAGALMLVLMTPVARADDDRPRTPWWRIVAVQGQLGLTPEQVTRIDTLYMRSLPRRRRLRTELFQSQERLAQAMTDGVHDEGRAAELVEAVVEAERRTNVARTMLLVHIYQVLTPSQRASLDHFSTPSRTAPPR
jgi:Spy/CpxP family protein refolding chaperone